MSDRPALVAVSGIPGAGKSTVSGLLARRFSPGVHLQSDMLQRMVVSGSVWPHDEPADEAARQLRQRGQATALLADSYVSAGFTVVVDDVLIGRRIDDLMNDLTTRPIRLVMLVPRLNVVAERDAQRAGKHVFARWSYLDEALRTQTTKVGLWLDSSDLSPDETVDEIMRRWDEARL